jgi:hypothetical protein
MLSPQIGNGAAFLATVSGLFQADKDVLPSMAVLAWSPAMYFALGVTAAGVLPLLMFWQQSFPERPSKGRHTSQRCGARRPRWVSSRLALAPLSKSRRCGSLP